MRRLTIPDASNMVLALHDEIQRSQDARYDHRLHAVLLVAQGMSPQEVANLFGDAPRTVQYWVRRFQGKGLAGLREEPRPGRPRRLQPEQIAEVQAALQRKPSEVGLAGNLWDGKTVAAYIEGKFAVELKARQCRNLLRQFRFSLRRTDSPRLDGGGDGTAASGAASQGKASSPLNSGKPSTDSLSGPGS